MSWQRLSRPAATFSCSTMALFTKPKRSCWPIILSPSSSRLTHPNSILLSGSGLTSKINWRVTCLPPWRNFLSRWLKLSVGIQPLTYAHLQRSLTSSRLLSQLMYTNHKETVLRPRGDREPRARRPPGGGARGAHDPHFLRQRPLHADHRLPPAALDSRRLHCALLHRTDNQCHDPGRARACRGHAHG